MFIFQKIDNLEEPEARKALTEPLKRTGRSFDGELVNRIIQETRGYPFFLQFYGYFLYETSTDPEVNSKDLDAFRKKLVKMLDESFFEDRFNLAGPKEKRMLIAMAGVVEEDKAAASSIQRKAGVSHAQMQSFFSQLTDKGLIYRAERGYYSFSIPLFKEFLLRQT